MMIGLNISTPAALSETRARQPAANPPFGRPSIVLIFQSGHFAQIGSAIVGFVAIDVVDQADWPPPVYE